MFRPLLVAVILLAVIPTAGAEKLHSAQPPVRQQPASAVHAKRIALSSPAFHVFLSPLSSGETLAIREAGNAALPRAHPVGIHRDLLEQDGAIATPTLWRASNGRMSHQWQVTSPGAKALRVAIRVVGLPAGSLLRVAAAHDGDPVHEEAPSGTALFWSPVVPGDSIRIELDIPEFGSAPVPQVTLEKIAHLVADPAAPQLAGFSKSADDACLVDVACEATADPALVKASASVARVLFARDGLELLCTGTLLNSTDGKFAPYLHTAAHCVDSQAVAETVQTWWFLESTRCGAPPEAGRERQLAGGATYLASDTLADFSLLRLNRTPPDGTIYAGWDASPLVGAHEVAGIHHPYGDPKKISRGSTRPVAELPEAYPFHSVRWSLGITAPGSSGSGLFTRDSETGEYLLRGALFGGLSRCPVDPDPAVDQSDVYSRLDHAWPVLRKWLAPGSAPANQTGLWWQPEEPGWGISFNHQGDKIFATMYAYGDDGRALWLVAPGLALAGDGSFSGEIYRTHGGDPDSAPWIAPKASMAGSMTVIFDERGGATLRYDYGGVTRSKRVERQVFGKVATMCVSTPASRSGSRNYQDLWWTPAEPGWGLSIAHQGDMLFATIYTYREDGTATWYVGPAVALQPDGSYAGDLFQTEGPSLGSASWAPIRVRSVGKMSLAFCGGESGTLAMVIDGQPLQKRIVRQVFGTTLPLCD